MKYTLLVFAVLALGAAATFPSAGHSCETYEDCGGIEDRTGDDRHDRDPIGNPGDDDRHDNDDSGDARYERNRSGGPRTFETARRAAERRKKAERAKVRRQNERRVDSHRDRSF